MATPPSATPQSKERSGPGCLLALLLLPVVIVVGVIVGTILNQKEDPNGEASVTLEEGTIGGTSWRVDAERDVDGDTCAFLYRDGELLTGACTLTPQDATIGEETVVFGRAASATTSVRVALSDGSVVEINTTTAKGTAGRFYVLVVDGDVDAEGFAT